MLKNKLSIHQAESTSEAIVKIVACSYEGSLFGWSVNESPGSIHDADETDGDNDESGLATNLIFGFNCGPHSLKSVAISKTGKYLACGGTDERVKLYSLQDQKSIGEVSIHTGAITTLKFYEDSILFVGSEVSFFFRLVDSFSFVFYHDGCCLVRTIRYRSGEHMTG